MISIVYTLEGQIGVSCFPSDVIGKKQAAEKFSLLVEDLQIKDNVEDRISGEKLMMFVNSVGSVQYLNDSAARPWFKIVRPSFRSRRCKCKK